MNYLKTSLLLALCVTFCPAVWGQGGAALAGVLPSGDMLAPTGKINLVAHKITLNSNIYTLTGNVRVKSSNMTVASDEASYDVARNIVAARGNVVFTTDKGVEYHGEGLQVNVVTKHWEFLNWSVAFSANSLGKPFLDKLYAGGAKIEGLPNEVIATESYVTTCNHLDDPHYEIRAEKLEIFPGDKVIAHKCDVYLLGKLIFRLPWFYMSLREHQSPIVPEFGSNATEGYYMRLRYQYVVNDNNIGTVRLDATTKRGEGLGINHFYTLPEGKGELFLYGREMLKEYVVRLDHQQVIEPADLNVEFHGDLRGNSSFTDIPTTLTNLSLNLTGPSKRPMWRAGYSTQKNESTISSGSSNANLSYNAPAAGGNLQYSTTYSRYDNGGATAINQDMWNRMSWTREVGAGTLNMRVDEHPNLGQQYYTGIQRLPDIYYEADAQKMDMDFLSSIPSRLTVGWGYYDERPGDVRLNRYLFNYSANPRVIKMGSTSLTMNGNLRQTFYGDKDATALYYLSSGINLQTIIGPLQHSLSFQRQQSDGFTPFQFDSVYPTEAITDNISLITNTQKIYISGGKDLLFKRWQDVAIRTESTLDKRWSMQHSAAYDPNMGSWRDLTSGVTFRDTPRLFTQLGTRYDLANRQLRQVTGNVNWKMDKNWGVQWMGGYDGINKQFLYNEYLITRDLHCWNVAFNYSAEQRSFGLSFRLKALDISPAKFGYGKGGQALGNGFNTGMTQY